MCLAVVAGYFLFYLLYFILMTAKQVESVMLERSDWNKLLGKKPRDTQRYYLL